MITNLYFEIISIYVERDNERKKFFSFVFRSLIRTFETNFEGTHARKNANKFGFLLT